MCSHTELTELPHFELASPAPPVPGAPQDCAPVNWNTQWMAAAVASPLPPLVLTMFDLDLSRTALNLIQTGHYLSLLWICCRLGSIYCNLKPAKIQKKDTTKCIVHVGCRVSISEWFSISHWSHSFWQVQVFACLFVPLLTKGRNLVSRFVFHMHLSAPIWSLK